MCQPNKNIIAHVHRSRNNKKRRNKNAYIFVGFFCRCRNVIISIENTCECLLFVICKGAVSAISNRKTIFYFFIFDELPLYIQWELYVQYKRYFVRNDLVHRVNTIFNKPCRIFGIRDCDWPAFLLYQLFRYPVGCKLILTRKCWVKEIYLVINYYEFKKLVCDIQCINPLTT